MHHTAERRAYARNHKLVRVHVADPADALDGLYPAWMTDRSSGGICLSFPRFDVEEGNLLQIQPASFAGVDLPWVEVRVKNCRRKPNRVELGCEFVQRQGWEQTLLLA